MEVYNIKNLYFVKPSIISYTKTRLVKEDIGIDYYNQKIKFEQRINNFDIVKIQKNEVVNITGNKEIEIFDYNYDDKKRYIKINKKDAISLKKYIRKNLKTKLKREYTKEELIELLSYLKRISDDTIKIKDVERNYIKKKFF